MSRGQQVSLQHVDSGELRVALEGLLLETATPYSVLTLYVALVFDSL